MTDQTGTDQVSAEEPQTIKLTHPDTDLVREVRPEDVRTWRTQGWREVKDDDTAPADAVEPDAAPAEPKRRPRAAQTPAAQAETTN